MASSINLLDFENAATHVARWMDRLGLREELPEDAELVLELNWASSAPGVDWPKAYFVAQDDSGDRWILWARNTDDPFLIGRECYPVAWCESRDSGAVAAASDLLWAFWQAMRDQYGPEPFEAVIRTGVLDHPKIDAVATAVWGSSVR